MVVVTVTKDEKSEHEYRAHDGKTEYHGDTLIIGDARVTADEIHADIECDHVLRSNGSIILID